MMLKRHKQFLKDFKKTKLTDGQFQKFVSFINCLIEERSLLDEIGVEGGSEIEQSALVLGTYLTPDIYVRYTTGLFDYINTVSLIYRLNRHVSVELQSGAIQAMDLWYDIDFGRD
jgi:hypothetical protein